jgi:tetratricopeptide (TPR) repeat protein
MKHLSDTGEHSEAEELAKAILDNPDIPLEQQVKILRYAGRYLQAKELATEILTKSDIPAEQRINMLISRANAEIRLGNVKKSIRDFENAVEISEANKLPVWLIRSKNGLGWAHRLTGNFERAEAYYQEARLLCLQEGGLDKKELKDDYGWIANNLAFVLSENSKTRQIAIDMARSTLEHWRSIGNDIGLGACYLVLGITYYRNALSKLSLDAFQKARNIFEPLKHYDRLAQIYSWRGALYQDMEELDSAERDLKKALEIGSPNIEAMTRNRLGRVYMSQEKWDEAEEYIQKSLECAQQIPDYKYWLSSVARLISIAAAKEEYQRLDEFDQMLKDCLSQIEKPEENALGVAYLGLAKLALGQNDLNNKDIIIDYLKQGIFLVTEFGSYARTGILSRLAIVEKHFQGINPEIIRSVGQALKDYIGQKAIEEAAYSIVTPIIYKWADWKNEE